MAEPERPQLNPYQVELEAGKRYAWCRCGGSKKQPFCDGSHEGTGIKPLMFTAERTELALLCGCKDTGDPPFCDGSHKTCGFESVVRANLQAPLNPPGTAGSR